MAAAAQPAATDGADGSSTPFDAALQACLADAPAPLWAAGDQASAGAGRADGDDPAVAPAADDGTSPSQQAVLLMTLLPISQAAAPVLPMTPPHAAAGAAAGQPAGDGAVRAGGLPAGGDTGAGPALVLAVAAGQGAPRPLPTSAPTAAAEAPQPATAAVAAALPMAEGPAVAAALPRAIAGEAGRPAAERVDGALSAAMLPVGSADAGAARSPDAPLRLPNGDAGQWRQPLMQALGERLQFASERGIDSAVIRLEPPRMGSIEIAIRHQDGALQVNLSATHNEVLRQLQDISDGLRHNLGQRHAGDVTVQVADAGSSRPGQGDGERQRQRQPQSGQNPGRALGEAEDDGGRPSFRLARNEE